MTALSDGMVQPSISFGFGSYNFATGEFRCLGKEGNSTLENIGYAFGAMANINDFWNLVSPNDKGAVLLTEKKDLISHSAWADEYGNGILSHGPDYTPIIDDIARAKLGLTPGVASIKSYFKFGLGLPRKSKFWDFSHYNNFETYVSNINKIPLRIMNSINRNLPYQGLTVNCVNTASMGAWLSGVPNIGLHPYLLNFSINLYVMGFRLDLFSYHLIYY